jgi:cytosine/adenosine deaminase-related metal-dependent hydrolase
MILRARCILPLGDSPIENGALVIKNGRIDWVGRWRECDAMEDHDVRDLGEVVLMPGLINAHVHLDYTNMAGQIPKPRSFPDWVKTILSFKAHWSCSEYAESWLKGARMLLESGTTTVADTESAPELLPQVWEATPLRVLSFLEMTGVKSQRTAREILSETLATMDALPRVDRKEAALSPHSLYSTQPELIRRSAEVANERDLLLSMHLAESESEFQMFSDARGPFHDWLKGQRKMDDCGRASPIQLADEYGILSPRLLAIHVNYLAPGDAELLARSGASVVHCPRSHEYFEHDPFPYAELKKAGVNICLGTDSLATARKIDGKPPELNLWNEMRAFARTHPGIAPKEILSMTTRHAAEALNKADQLGKLSPGTAADCAAMTYIGTVNEARLHEELLYSGTVREVFIAGELAKAG